MARRITFAALIALALGASALSHALSPHTVLTSDPIPLCKPSDPGCDLTGGPSN